MRKLLSLLTSAAFFAGCGYSPAVPLATARGPSERAALGVHAREVLVKLASGASSPWKAPLGKVVRSIPQLGWVVVELGGAELVGAIAQLRATKGVVAAEPQQQLKLESMPATNDSDLAKEKRYFDRIQLQSAWAVTTGSPNVVVAVLDTGVDPNHPDLVHQLVPGYDIVHDNAHPLDDCSHGTACAGIVAAEANNGIGIAGIAPGCRVMPVKVLDCQGGGPIELAAKGFVWAADHGAKVISFSSGQDAPSEVLQDAIDYVRARDVVVVTAMGNDGNTVKHWPACCDGVLAVGATCTEDDSPASFTTGGSWVCIAAPGNSLWTTMPTYKYGEPSAKPALNYGMFAGTSGACPIVAGVAALLRSKYPQMTESQVRERLEATADDVGPKGWDEATGAGRVNALKALTAR